MRSLSVIATMLVTLCGIGCSGAIAPQDNALVEALRIVTTSLPDATVGVAYSRAISANGGSQSGYNWRLVAGILPDGLSLAISSGDAVISGVPAQAGQSSFQLEVTDSASNRASASFTINVAAAVPGMLSITSTAQFALRENVAFSMALGASGGAAPYAWSMANAPAWLTLDGATGVLAGTPPAGSAGAYTADVTVSDASAPAQSAAQQLQIDVSAITPPSPLQVLTIALPQGFTAIPYLGSISVSGGVPPYTFSLLGSLPAGLQLDSATGAISGTPASGSGGLYSLVTYVYDSAGATASDQITLEIVAASLTFPWASLPDATLTTSYSHQLAAIGGIGNLTWQASGLPAGLSCSAQGLIAGTPTGPLQGAYEVFPVRIDVADAQGMAIGGMFDLTILSGTPAPGLTILPPSPMPVAGIGHTGTGAHGYEIRFQAAGGVGPYDFSFSNAGTLPSRFTLSNDGCLRGVARPGDAGSHSVTIRVLDADGQYGLQSVTIDIVSPPGMGLTPEAVNDVLPQACEGVPYSFKPTVAGPLGNYVWFVDWNNTVLPDGLTIFENVNSGGLWPAEVRGTPAPGSAAGGPYPIRWTIAAGSDSVTQTCTLDVAVTTAPFHILNRDALVEGYAGQFYGDRLVAAGDAGAGIDWIVASGALPPGLSLDAQGHICGMIATSAAGTHTFVARARTRANAAAPYITADVRGSITVHPAPAPGTMLRIAGTEDSGCLTGAYEDGIAAARADIQQIWGIAFDAHGDMVFTECRFSTRVRKISRATGIVSTVAGNGHWEDTGDGGPASRAGINMPGGIAFDASNNCYVGGVLTGRLRRIDNGGSITHAAMASGTVPTLTSVVFDPAHGYLYIADAMNNCIYRYEPGTAALVKVAGAGGTQVYASGGDGGPARQAFMMMPYGLGMDSSGNLYVGETDGGMVRKITPDTAAGGIITGDSIITTVAGTQGTYPHSDIVCDSSGTLYYHNWSTGCIDSVPASGGTVTAVAGSVLSNPDKTALARDPITGDMYLGAGWGLYKVIR